MQVIWKDYVVDIYNQNSVYYHFDFYEVYDLGNNEYQFVEGDKRFFTLKNFREVLLQKPEGFYRIDPNFSIYYRIDYHDTRFYTAEMFIEDDTFAMLQEALVFCKEQFKSIKN